MGRRAVVTRRCSFRCGLFIGGRLTRARIRRLCREVGTASKHATRILENYFKQKFERAQNEDTVDEVVAHLRENLDMGRLYRQALVSCTTAGNRRKSGYHDAELQFLCGRYFIEAGIERVEVLSGEGSGNLYTYTSNNYRDVLCKNYSSPATVRKLMESVVNWHFSAHRADEKLCRKHALELLKHGKRFEPHMVRGQDSETHVCEHCVGHPSVAPAVDKFAEYIADFEEAKSVFKPPPKRGKKRGRARSDASDGEDSDNEDDGEGGQPEAAAKKNTVNARIANAIALRHWWNAHVRATATVKEVTNRKTGVVELREIGLAQLVPWARKHVPYVRIDFQIMKAILLSLEGHKEGKVKCPRRVRLPMKQAVQGENPLSMQDFLNVPAWKKVKFFRNLTRPGRARGVLSFPATFMTNGFVICVPFEAGEGSRKTRAQRNGKGWAPVAAPAAAEADGRGEVDFMTAKCGTFRLDDVQPDPQVPWDVEAADTGRKIPLAISNGNMWTNDEHFGSAKAATVPDEIVKQRRDALCSEASANHMLHLDAVTAWQGEYILFLSHAVTVSCCATVTAGAVASAARMDAIATEFGSNRSLKRVFWRSRLVQARTMRVVFEVIFPGGVTENTVLAWGAGYNPPAVLSKGTKFPPVVKGLLKAVARFVRVVLIDEYLTSQMCVTCHKKLQETANDRWKYCPYCAETVHRDGNAARNIRAVLVAHLNGEERPDYLCRPGAPRAVEARAPREASV
ncbi:MAG: transposase [Bdellovibrionales bacterium]|nr:transposase [Bdellovibrionales bacterium]